MPLFLSQDEAFWAQVGESGDTHAHTQFQGVLYEGNVLRHVVHAGDASEFDKYSRTSLYRHETENILCLKFIRPCIILVVQ